MIAATPVHGGHYIVDLLAGAALAGAVLAILARRPAYRGLFARHGGQPGGVTQQAIGADRPGCGPV
ncbi:MAG: hypothetical protein WCZ72_12195 [Gemmobacter sp.]